jgi:hypothetical protein
MANGGDGDWRWRLREVPAETRCDKLVAPDGQTNAMHFINCLSFDQLTHKVANSSACLPPMPRTVDGQMSDGQTICSSLMNRSVRHTSEEG